MAIDISKQYELLTKWVAKRLNKKFHDRHLEDCIQHVAMEAFKNANKFEEYGIGGRWDWYLANYCRENGLNSTRSKGSAKTIEQSISIDAPGKESDNSYYLLDQESISRSKPSESLSIKGHLEEFLGPLFINKEALRWAVKSFKVKQKLK